MQGNGSPAVSRFSGNGRSKRITADCEPPPHNADAEKALLGGLLLVNDAFADVPDLEAGDFYSEAHRLVFEAAKFLVDSGRPADAVTVAEELARRGQLADVGGPVFLGDLLESVPHAAHSVRYAEIVLDYAAKRAAMYAARKLADLATDPQTTSTDLAAHFSEAADSFRFPIDTIGDRNEFLAVPISQLGESEPVDWLWGGWLARAFSTLFVGYPKAGKTTLLTHLLKASAAGGEIAGPIGLARCLVVSEEGETHWKLRRDKLGLADNVAVVNRPFIKGRPSLAEWNDLIASLARQVRDCGFDLVVIDTLGNLAPQYKTNDDAETVSILAPLQQIMEAGAALLLIHHAGKSDVGEGKAARGSSALTGWVDIIAELRRYDAGRLEDNRRRLRGYGRFEETPHELVIELADGTYTTVGSTADARTADHRDVLLSILQDADGALTVEQVAERHPADVSPSRKVIRRELESGATAGLWPREGKGVKGDPHVYGWGRTGKLFEHETENE